MIRSLSIFIWLAASTAHSLEIQSLGAFKKALIEHAPSVISSRESISISARNKNSAFGALLPRLDLNSSLLFDHQSEPDPLDSSSTSLGLKANLYNSNMDWYGYNQAQHQEKVSKLQYYTQVSDLILRGINSYLDFSDSAVSLEVAERRKRLVDEQFRHTKRSYESGTSTRLNFLRLQAEKKSSEFELKRAESDFQKSKNNLEALFDQREKQIVFKPLKFGTGQKLPPITENFEVSRHPEYSIKNEQKKIADLEVKKAQRSYWPHVDLNTEFRKNLSGYWVKGSTSDWGTDFQTALLVSFNLFDGGQLSNDLSNRRSQVIIASADMDQKRLEIDSKLKNLKIESEKLKLQVRNAIEILKIQTEVFQSISQEYRVGNISYLDFISSLNQRLSAQKDFQSSISSYLKIYYSSLYHQGVLLDE
ncbi:MAG TPA: hypothetical protein DCL41_06205 [Bdellovibrionales bacterium]|nr:hypothetical protein [Pseudobdellovibrionaceae bacterium]HAG91442.1 hypothetical protein [Bdellovibrionales bacterium]|tara:strand:+ start:3287 stop:4546 length:1260 start_codon:yes stop_codon:yes gene_type:complete